MLLIVGAGRDPISIPTEEIEAVRALLRSGAAARPHPFLKADDKVYVEHGPFAGVEGCVINADKKFRLVVSIPLLQRSVSVEIDRDCVRPMSKRVA